MMQQRTGDSQCCHSTAGDRNSCHSQCKISCCQCSSGSSTAGKAITAAGALIAPVPVGSHLHSSSPQGPWQLFFLLQHPWEQLEELLYLWDRWRWNKLPPIIGMPRRATDYWQPAGEDSLAVIRLPGWSTTKLCSPGRGQFSPHPKMSAATYLCAVTPLYFCSTAKCWGTW